MWSEKLWIILTLITVIPSQISAQARFKNTSEHQNVDIIQKIRPQDAENHTEFLSDASNMKYSSQTFFEIVLANSMKNFLPFSHVNKNCVSDGLQYKIGLKNQTRWAVQMYESSTKYPGSDMQLGNFDRCMSTSSDSLGIRGAYALARMRFYSVDDDAESESSDPKVQNQSRAIKVATNALVKTFDNSTIPMPVGKLDLLWALCFPDSCTNEDVETSVRHALTPDLTKSNRVAIEVTVPSSTYTSRHTEMPVTNAVLLARGIFVLGLALAAACTLYDWLKRSENDTFFDSSVRAFSVTRNLRNLTADSKDDEFAIANGIKTVGMVTIIMGHRIALDMELPSFNPEYLNDFSASFWLSFMKTSVSLEIFFVLSGFFMYIMIEKRLRNGKPLKFIHALSYRLARILPTYITVIVIYILFLPYIGDGPLWKFYNYSEAEYCRKNWWTNLLFINNYVNSNELCMIPAWYLACDIHFFIVGTILTYIIWRWKTIGFGIFSIMLAASVYIPAKVMYDNEDIALLEFRPSNLRINIRTVKYFQNIHIKSHNRITTYFIGMAAAYIYLKIKNSTVKISPKSRTLGIIICVLSISACYIVTGFFYLPGQTYNPWYHLFYFTFQRIVFSLTVAYVLVVGSLSNFGFISSIFECKMVVVISRISYVVYLVHFIVQLQNIGQIRQPLFENFWSLYWRINTDIMIALFYSLLINLIVEAPSRKIFQRIMDIFTENERGNLDSDVQQVTENRTAENCNVAVQMHNIGDLNPVTDDISLGARKMTDFLPQNLE